MKRFALKRRYLWYYNHSSASKIEQVTYYFLTMEHWFCIQVSFRFRGFEFWVWACRSVLKGILLRADKYTWQSKASRYLGGRKETRKRIKVRGTRHGKTRPSSKNRSFGRNLSHGTFIRKIITRRTRIQSGGKRGKGLGSGSSKSEFYWKKGSRTWGSPEIEARTGARPRGVG